jgi:hypothetical protein
VQQGHARRAEANEPPVRRFMLHVRIAATLTNGQLTASRRSAHSRQPFRQSLHSIGLLP